MSAAGSSDAWDAPSAEPPRKLVSARQSEPVPDDWDDDEDEEEDAHKLWEDANTRAPMPQLVIAPSATAPFASAPPAAAFQPSIRILKRPSANSSSPSATPSNDPQQKSLADREAEYQAARDRIFGAQAASPDSKSPVPRPSRGPSSTPPVRDGTPPVAKPIRAPRGPEKASDPSNPALAKGFRNRNSQAPASTQPSS